MSNDRYKLILAPMDGVLDGPMREILTSVNDFSYAVSEFIRIVDRPVSASTLLKKVPELATGGKTLSGTPVYVQFLGQSPKNIAKSAMLAAKMGAPGIDLNFGCPAKQVNKTNGGAALLKTPELMHEICVAVRDAVPCDIPVCAKIRLGYEDTSNFMGIAESVLSAGISALCVHGRTKKDAYLDGTVKWDLIGEISKISGVEVIANGDIFSKESADRCSEIAHTESLMLGRGVLYVPNLACVINGGEAKMSAKNMAALVRKFRDTAVQKYDFANPFPRVKQFLSYLREGYPFMMEKGVFKDVCRAQNDEQALDILDKAVNDEED